MPVIVQDTFTDVDTTSLDAHTPNVAPSGGWTEQGGNWLITGNAAVLSGNNNNAHSTIQCNNASCTLTCEADNNSGSGALGTESGLAARWSDVNNYWRIGINASDDSVKIVERNGGANTLRASGGVTGGVTGGVFYTLQTILSGSSITVTVEGTDQINYGSATLNQTATIHGIIARNGTSDRVDDFVCETAAGGGGSIVHLFLRPFRIWKLRR